MSPGPSHDCVHERHFVFALSSVSVCVCVCVRLSVCSHLAPQLSCPCPQRIHVVAKPSVFIRVVVRGARMGSFSLLFPSLGCPRRARIGPAGRCCRLAATESMCGRHESADADAALPPRSVVSWVVCVCVCVCVCVFLRSPKFRMQEPVAAAAPTAAAVVAIHSFLLRATTIDRVRASPSCSSSLLNVALCVASGGPCLETKGIQKGTENTPWVASIRLSALNSGPFSILRPSRLLPSSRRPVSRL